MHNDLCLANFGFVWRFFGVPGREPSSVLTVAACELALQPSSPMQSAGPAGSARPSQPANRRRAKPLRNSTYRKRPRPPAPARAPGDDHSAFRIAKDLPIRPTTVYDAFHAQFRMPANSLEPEREGAIHSPTPHRSRHAWNCLRPRAKSAGSCPCSRRPMAVPPQSGPLPYQVRSIRSGRLAGRTRRDFI